MHKINEQLSLEHLLQETINVNDYLIVLVHIGVALASGMTASPTFSIASEFHRENLLQPLLKTHRASLQKLVALTSAAELCAQGEETLVDFVTSISEKHDEIDGLGCIGLQESHLGASISVMDHCWGL